VPNAAEERDYNWISWRVKGFHYEAAGHSEVNFIVTAHDIYNYLNGSSVGFPNAEHTGKIGSLTWSEVSNSTWIAPSSTYPFLLKYPLNASDAATYRYFYITTYEHDWYSYKKKTSYCQVNGHFQMVKHHWCKMKYNNEWYINDICSFDHYAYFPGVNYVWGFQSTKMDASIKRVL
jgi:hypothetical protein